MLKVKVTAVGNSMGILLPKEALGKLNAERGDTLYLVEGPEGYTLTIYDPEFEEQVTVARGIMKRYKNALKELAK
jgi:putative addiction module antidote